MRFPIPLVIDLPDDQLAEWAAGTGVTVPGIPVRAKDAVDAMREQVPEALKAYFTGLGVRAEISIKQR